MIKVVRGENDCRGRQEWDTFVLQASLLATTGVSVGSLFPESTQSTKRRRVLGWPQPGVTSPKACGPVDWAVKEAETQRTYFPLRFRRGSKINIKEKNKLSHVNRSNQNYPTSPSRTNLGLFAWQLEMRPTLSLLGGMCLSIPSGRLLPLSLRRYSFPWALRISHASSYTYQNFMHMVQTVYCQVFCLSKVMIPSTPSKKKKKGRNEAGSI